MDYDSIDLCIRSIEESRPGYYYVDMVSRYDIDPQSPLEIDQYSVDYITKDPYQVPMCPPGWPIPPELSDD